MTRPNTPSRAAYVVSCRSYARQTAPTDRAVTSAKRLGSARITRMVGVLVALVVGAADQEVAVEVVLLDVEVELQERLRDLGGCVADRTRIVDERQENEVRRGAGEVGLVR